jgi:hypothetical protein
MAFNQEVQPKFSKKRNGRKNQNALAGGRNYAAPLLKHIALPPAVITLDTQLDLSSTLGVNGSNSPLTYAVFRDISSYATVYQYFEIIGWKIEFTLSQRATTIDSFDSAYFAWHPINYIIESASASVPSDARSIAALPGAINVQPGFTNKGAWFPPLVKQVYSTLDAASVSTPRIAGTVLGYFGDVGALETIGTVMLYMNVKFYSRQYVS